MAIIGGTGGAQGSAAAGAVTKRCTGLPLGDPLGRSLEAIVGSRLTLLVGHWEIYWEDHFRH